MKMNLIDASRILLIVVGMGGLATDQLFEKNITQLFGAEANAVIAGLSATSAIASVVLHTVTNPTPSTPKPPTPVPEPTPAPVEIKPKENPYTYALPTKG
jgi:hypothetical protein